MPDPAPTQLLRGSGDWQAQLAFVLDMMREMSNQTDPQVMVKTYGQRMSKVIPSDASISLSRRDLDKPAVRITRSSRWEQSVNPWKSRDALPVFDNSLLGEIIWSDEPLIIDDLPARLSPDEPAIEYLKDYGSLCAIPLYDKGVALNMVVIFRKQKNGFERDRLPEHVWMANLFGRATQNLVLSDQLKKAYEQVDRELKVVAEIQQSLLPTTLPRIPTLDIAAHYQTSTRAGGDYYDFFELPDGKWGILIADVSGHGTPAAVIMAVTHSIAHMLGEPSSPPSRLMEFVNRHLAARYTGGSGTFVTAFYGIYDPSTGSLEYSSAGHPPGRILRCGQVTPLDGKRSLPLGIDEDEQYNDSESNLRSGDVLILYTDGITEARNQRGDMFGEDRLDQAAVCKPTASAMLESVLTDLDAFRHGRKLNDDRTLLVIRVSGSDEAVGEGI